MDTTYNIVNKLLEKQITPDEAMKELTGKLHDKEINELILEVKDIVLAIVAYQNRWQNISIQPLKCECGSMSFNGSCTTGKESKMWCSRCYKELKQTYQLTV